MPAAQSLLEELSDSPMNEPLGTNAGEFDVSTLLVSVIPWRPHCT